MKIEAVIGANYGDEGKGKLTAYVCRNSKRPCVVLANGGCQRGHTVVHEKRGEFTFHHFGSGTLDGVPTYFAPTFLVNPMQFVKEYKELKALGVEPVVYIDKRCRMQLPCDIALNWHIEKCRGENRHGSVGCGIWETVRRYQTAENAVSLYDFVNTKYNEQVAFMKSEAERIMKARCSEEGVSPDVEIMDLFTSAGFQDHFIADALETARIARLDSKNCDGNFSGGRFVQLDFDYSPCQKTIFESELFDTLVFECGQGLGLDQYYNAGQMDYTTPSFTGSQNIAKLLSLLRESNDNKIDDVRLNYVSRTFLTRHGMGPMDTNEDIENTYEDPTNSWSEWQGSFRTGELDVCAMLERCQIDADLFAKTTGIRPKTRMAFTHCDIVSPPKDVFVSGMGVYENTLVSSSRMPEFEMI